MGSVTAAVVLTSCSKRKKLAVAPQLRPAALEPGDAAGVARQWAAIVAQAQPRVPAGELYCGRAFGEAKAAAQALGARFHVVSAGLGLIAAELPVPAYSLSVASGPDNIHPRLQPRVSAALWWRELGKAMGSNPLQDLLAGSSGPALIALSAPYLSMIGPELEELGEAERGRLRLFTAASPAAIPPGLRPFVMSYDRRLEALPGRRGTLSDFAQRALRHFAEVILPGAPEADCRAHAQAVSAALGGIEAPQRSRGRSLSDSEIVALIEANWHAAAGKSAAMLRLLRDSFSVACEQKRFKKLFDVARTGCAG